MLRTIVGPAIEKRKGVQKQTTQVLKPKNKDNKKEPEFVQLVCFLSEQMLGMGERVKSKGKKYGW